MAILLISLIVQLRYSRETRVWAMSIGHKGLFIATLLSLSGISMVGLIKFMIDKSREAIEKEDKRLRL